MAFKNEAPLRGWKEICPLLNVNDERTAQRILRAKNLLHYEGRTPVLLASEYLRTLGGRR
jgi:hypothetical protein